MVRLLQGEGQDRTEFFSLQIIRNGQVGDDTQTFPHTIELTFNPRSVLTK